ncbi:hypothetical protein HPB48_009425 [Haemaphysalis longicornis]|uniref:THAP-type domain-containing protein n=1 Tax=Haemaphysalis longicornis TaxID=44386 RepID=A0A9J6GJ89_HAELO|nr:hypothetical protein HPB48_009425 [Haemaphysalis longicornis]
MPWKVLCATVQRQLQDRPQGARFFRSLKPTKQDKRGYVPFHVKTWSCQRTARVCERHFKAEDIVRKTSYIDQATGRTVAAPLSRLRLRAEAVPTVFPDCPSYLSIESSRREDPESKRMRLEAASLEKVLAESILTAKKEEEADKLCDLKDVQTSFEAKS